MEQIELPKISEEKIQENYSKFVIEPLYPGYGATIGNSLRRVLLSSITGAAITSFKIEGVNHEFSGIENVKEDVVQVIMNLKNVFFKSFADEPVVLELSKKGHGAVTAKDFKPNSRVEIVNPDTHIVTLEKGADFYMEVTVQKGRGFQVVNLADETKGEIGRIAVDALFSPVERVSIHTEDTRVGQMTNFDKLTLEVITNGTISPNDALTQASNVLVDHFKAIAQRTDFGTEDVTSDMLVEPAEEEENAESTESDESLDSKTKIEELNLSQRTTNALINSGIKTVGGLKRLSHLKLEEIKGLGKKGIDEINELLGNE